MLLLLASEASEPLSRVTKRYFNIYINTIAASFFHTKKVWYYFVIPQVWKKCNTDLIGHGDLFAFVLGSRRFFCLGAYLVELLSNYVCTYID